MKVSRRSFIRASSALALSTTLLGSVETILGQNGRAGTLVPIPVESTTDPLNYLSSQHFAPFVNTTLIAQGGNARPVRLQLLEVKELTNETNTHQGFTGESFSLLFSSADQISRSGQRYTFRHDSLGTFSLFVTPVGMTGNRCEAVVNRISRTA